MKFCSRRDRIRAEVKMKYKILLEKSDEGYSVSCPGLPGCWSQGETEEEAIENIQDAIQGYLAAIDELVKNADVREVEVTV
jgi:predicted RNase H-like HicB family nuclease